MRWPPLKRLRARRPCQPKNLLHRNRRRHPRRWPNRLRPPCHFRRRPLRQHLKRSASLRWCPHGPRRWCTHRRPCGSSRRGRSIRPRRNPAHRHSPPHRHRPRHDRRPPAQSASAQPRRSFRQDWLLEWTQTEPRPIRDWRVSAANRGVCYCASTYPRMAARSRWQSCRRAAIQASIRPRLPPYASGALSRQCRRADRFPRKQTCRCGSASTIDAARTSQSLAEHGRRPRAAFRWRQCPPPCQHGTKWPCRRAARDDFGPPYHGNRMSISCWPQRVCCTSVISPRPPYVMRASAMRSCNTVLSLAISCGRITPVT